jgi:hypothetical protein|nr:MAG TPA: replisome organizer [Caudoviricetes sp.]
MAEKRMFSMKIVDSDPFKEMPLSAQALYFHLVMNADDEGFLNNAKSVQRSIMASDDDMKLLIAKDFIIRFESGIMVIKHWKMHNTIQPSRLKPTQYIEERKLLEVKENKSYTLNLGHVSPLPTDCQQNDSECQQNDAEIRLEEIRLEECSVVESEPAQPAPTTTPSSVTYNSLIKQYGKEFVDERIERAKMYKRTNNLDTVAKWCAEDFKRQKTKHKQNTFNSFPQRPYDFWDNNDDLIVINQPNDSS